MPIKEKIANTFVSAILNSNVLEEQKGYTYKAIAGFELK